MSIKYGRVITDNKASQLDKPFTYIINEDLVDYLKVGMRVIIPFGRGNKLIKGLLVAIDDDFDGDYKLKEIVDTLDDKPIVSKELLDLSKWMRDKYLSSYLSSLQTVLPPGDYKKVNTFIYIMNKEYKAENLEEENILNYLLENDEVLLSKLKLDLNINYINKYLNILEDKGVIGTYIDIETSVKKKMVRFVKLDEELDLEEILDRIGKQAFRQRELAEYLYEYKDQEISEVMKKLDLGLSVVNALVEKEVGMIYEKEISRDPIKKEIKDYHKHDLNEEQEKIYNEILMASLIGDINNNKFLIHGVTGSGKTEIYLQLVEAMISMGKDSIILVPEIALTPQTIDRFVGRFGDNVAIIHSKLSQGERFDEWRRIKDGEVKIVVGARSAVFAPFKNLGMIVIDEEHETTYKSSQNPKYDTIEVASKRVDMENGVLVLGSATPSLETFYKTKIGKIKRLVMDKRVRDIPMPEIKVVDMRMELELGNRSIFSKDLYEGIEAALGDKKQIILFLNRRGFSTFVSCRECGYVVKCDSCDISMTYHRNVNRLRCHYCGDTKPIPKNCPDCGSKYIKYFGIGTEQVEEITRNTFPDARVERMDGDTTKTKDSYESILGRMKNKEIDILIGTQMISKGLDFENVTLVGIIAADTVLNLPDFRSPEKTFQLITQVSGRAGRGEDLGKVVLQTYDPDHYSIKHSKNHDYMGFVEEELPVREVFMYPPYIELINIIIYGENIRKVMDISDKIYKIIGSEIHHLYGDNYFRYIIGPNPAPLERIKNNHRYQILIKSEFKDMKRLKNLIYRVCISNNYNLELKNIKINIDINPMTIL